MVGDINGGRPDARVRLSWRPPRLRLSDLMAVMAVAVLPSTHGQCAAIGPHCYCIHNQHVICNNLGNVSQVPPFRHSKVHFYRVTIRGNTTVSKVQTGAFIGVVADEVIVEKMGIVTIELGAFLGLEKYLKRVFLNDNLLETIHEDMFKEFYKLHYILLYNNRLITLSPRLFRDVVHPAFVLISGNPFECDYRLMWLRTTTYIRFHNPVCHSPPSVAGTPVVSYDTYDTPTETGIVYMVVTVLLLC